MKNRISRAFVIISVIVMTALTLNIESFAAEKKIRMVEAVLPNITAEISGDVRKSEISYASIDGKKLSVTDVSDGNEATKLVYLLVDVSGSMHQYYFDALKPSLISYAQSLSDDDKFVLMTFGSEIEYLLTGGESDKEIEDTINSISCDSATTNFYSALNEAYDSATKEKNYDRKYCITVSDGADIEKGNSSQQEHSAQHTNSAPSVPRLSTSARVMVRLSPE